MAVKGVKGIKIFRWRRIGVPKRTIPPPSTTRSLGPFPCVFGMLLRERPMHEERAELEWGAYDFPES